MPTEDGEKRVGFVRHASCMTVVGDGPIENAVYQPSRPKISLAQKIQVGMSTVEMPSMA